jgi:hypothetical protein
MIDLASSDGGANARCITNGANAKVGRVRASDAPTSAKAEKKSKPAPITASSSSPLACSDGREMAQRVAQIRMGGQMSRPR